MAANDVLFLGWNRPVTGRESKAGEMFQSFIAYLTKQQTTGTVESFEPVVLNAHGGDLNGFFLIRGDRNKLATMRASNDFQDIVTQTAVYVDRFGVVDGWTGEGAKNIVGRYLSYSK